MFVHSFRSSVFFHIDHASRFSCSLINTQRIKTNLISKSNEEFHPTVVVCFSYKQKKITSSKFSGKDTHLLQTKKVMSSMKLFRMIKIRKAFERIQKVEKGLRPHARRKTEKKF